MNNAKIEGVLNIEKSIMGEIGDNKIVAGTIGVGNITHISDVTKEYVDTELAKKQNILIAGNNIDIEDDVINANVQKLEHSLTIGDKVFDGSNDVTIEVYDGSLDDNNNSSMQSVLMCSNVSRDTEMVQSRNMSIINDKDSPTLQMSTGESSLQLNMSNTIIVHKMSTGSEQRVMVQLNKEGE